MENDETWTILIVEDDSGVAQLQRRRLERAGYKTQLAATAEQALEILATSHIDLAILDYDLSANSNGLELHSRMLKLGRRIPVIMVTGLSNESTVVRALRAGVRDFVTKSTEYLDYLPEAVKRILHTVEVERRLASSEARLAAIFESAKDGIISIDEDRRIILFNPAAEKIFGYSAAEAIGKPLERFIPREWDADAFAGEGRPPTFSTQLRDGRWGVRQNGERFPLEASTAKTEVQGSKSLTVVVRDVTERRRAEADLKTQHAVARVMAVAKTFEEAVPQILAALCENYGWQASSLWTVDQSLNALVLLDVWRKDSLDLSPLVREMRRVLFTRGVGTPGIVWERREPVFVADAAADASLLRHDALAAVGLRSICAFPIVSQSEVVAVIEFYSPEPRKTATGFVELMEALGGQVGQFIERKRAERDVVRSERDLAEAQRLANLGSWRWIVTRDVILASEEMRSIFGVGKDELAPALVEFLRRLPEFKGEEQANGNAVERTKPFERHRRIRRPDGSTRTLHVRGRRAFNEDGTLREMFGTAQDVTDRVMAEERIREQAALLDQARDAIIVEGNDGTIHYWNQGAERVFGWTAAEAIGQRAAQLLSGGKAKEWELAKRSLASGGEWCGELQQVTKAGKELILESRWTQLYDERGKPKARLIIQTDITERKRLEAQFHRAQRLESLGTLAGGIAHDLNNIFTPIRMSLDLLRLDLSTAQRVEVLDSLQESALRGSEMVRQVLSFARGEAGQRVEFALPSLIDELIRLLRQSLPKDRRLKANLGADLPAIHGDPTQIHQLLMNLCINASDATTQGGTITLSAERVALDLAEARRLGGERAGEYVRLSVEDDGPGIPAPIKEKIFEPFFTTKAVGVGTGLGLATVQGIAKGHGGFVQVDSTVGVGTRFDVYLPVAGSCERKAPSSHENASLQPTKSVLVVEGDSGSRERRRVELEDEGFDVVTAATSEEAAGLLSRHGEQIGAVVADLRGASAHVVQFLRDVDRRVPIILTAANAADSSPPPRGNNQLLLANPYSPQSLFASLRTALRTGAVVPRSVPAAASRAK